MMTTAAVYCIECTETDEKYIGASINVEGRWGQHKRDAERGQHQSQRFNEAWDEYGPDAFEFRVLEEVEDPEDLGLRELHWYKKLGGEFNTYVPSGNSILWSEEARARKSEALAGRELSEEHRAKISAAMTGRELSDEHRAKISAAMTDEVRAKISESVSTAMTDEVRAKISEAMAGRKRGKLSDETRAKISEALTGERNVNAKLRWEDACEIKRLALTTDLPKKLIAQMWGVKPITVYKIASSATWKHLISHPTRPGFWTHPDHAKTLVANDEET